MENVVKKDVLRASNEEANRITKECIRTALISLIAVKPFDKITITELVLKSGVSRMSFYRNYKSKEDVILDMCTELEAQLTESIADKTYENDPLKWYRSFFNSAKSHENEIALLFGPNMPQSISYKILSSASAVFIGLSDTDEDKYKAAAWVGALIGIIFRWFSEGMKQSPDEMAELCMKVIN